MGDQRRSAAGPVVVSLGGGVNSTAMLVLLLAQGRRPDLILFADTSAELPGTYHHVEHVLPPWLRDHDFPPITHVRGMLQHASTLEEDCLKRAAMPSLAYGRRACSDHWKVRPQRRYLQDWEPARKAWYDGESVTFLIGYDFSECHRHPVVATRQYAYEYPLLAAKWTRQRCRDAILTVGLPIPPKSACFFCPAYTKPEVLRLSLRHPDLFERACRIEDIALASGNAAYLKGLGRHWSWRSLISADRAQLRLFSETTPR